MKIYKEERLTNFDFWGGAKDRASKLTVNELYQIEDILTDCYSDGLNETTINDIFWFDFDWVCECLGTTEDEVLDR